MVSLEPMQKFCYIEFAIPTLEAHVLLSQITIHQVGTWEVEACIKWLLMCVRVLVMQIVTQLESLQRLEFKAHTIPPQMTHVSAELHQGSILEIMIMWCPLYI